MQIARWGNSLAVRLPAVLVRRLGLREGDMLQVAGTCEGEIVVASADDPDTILFRLRKLRGLMPEGFKFDREEANARGPERA